MRITVTGDKFEPRLNNGFPSVRTEIHIDPLSCQVYQIYWFKEVSVWIDYVKIMDEPAYQFFNHQFFGESLKHKDGRHYWTKIGTDSQTYTAYIYGRNRTKTQPA